MSLSQGKNKIPHQIGNRSRRSTIDAIRDIVRNVDVRLTARKILAKVFVNFSKNFETVDHEIVFLNFDAFGSRHPNYK